MTVENLRSSLVDIDSGTITVEPDDGTLFACLGLEPSARVDAADIERRYLALSRHLHPDFQAAAGADVQALAVANSARLNEAYSTLLDDQQRLEYLLTLTDIDALERNKTLAPMFLMESMEHSETVESADADARVELAKTYRGEVRTRLDNAVSALDAGDVDRAATLLQEARVFRRILRDCKAR